MKINNMSMLALVGLLSLNASAKMVEYYEDAYAQQAPQELVEKVAKVADKINYTQDYQVVVPKKPGLQINPANKMTTYGFNPQTKNPFILINPEWFSTLNQEQQDFLIARSLMLLQESTWHSFPKLFPWIWMLFLLALSVLVFFALKRSPLGSKPVWMRILAVYVIFAIANFSFGNALFVKMNSTVGQRFDARVTRMALEKMGQDKQVAISLFQAMDELVKKELAQGDTFWKVYENAFSDLAERLQ